VALCAGSLPLAPEDRVECLAILAADSDASIFERAQNALLSAPPALLVAALDRADADPRLFEYCAENCPDQPGIADRFAANPACATELVARVASYLTPTGIQALLDNIERFSSDDLLVLAVAQTKNATSEQRTLLDELQKGALTEAEVAATAAEVEPDAGRRVTLTQKLAKMNVVQRLTTALKGGREERLFLIRDPNTLVQRAVLQSPRLTDTEVELFAAQTNLSVEVLRAISMSRLFMKNYAIVKNLCYNSKTPLDVSLALIKRLNATDLAKLTTNKNVPETLRSSAQKLHRKRKAGGSDE
jgi:hypothetical protein